MQESLNCSVVPPAYQQDSAHVFQLILEDKENPQHQQHLLEHETQRAGFEPSQKVLLQILSTVIASACKYKLLMTVKQTQQEDQRIRRLACLVIAANFSANSTSPFIKGKRQPLPSNASTILIIFTPQHNNKSQHKYTQKMHIA